MDYLWFCMGLALGTLTAGTVFYFRSLAKRAELEAQIAAAKENQDDFETHVLQTFSAMAAEALKSSNETFLQLAEQSLRTQVVRAQGELDQRKQSIDDLIKPLQESLREIEKHRQEAYGSLKQQVESMVTGQEKLTRETGHLSQALRAPQVRGRWGEMTLRRVAELAGMVERCDFFEQEVFSSRLGDQRPDMVVHLPSNRLIAVDAKTPLDAYLRSLEAQNDEEKNSALKNHARQLKDRVHELSAKTYWTSLGFTPEFVILFLPGEFFLEPALKEEPGLLEEAMRDKVVLATPSTLVSLLQAVADGWRQEKIAENAREISDLGRELHDRLYTWATQIQRHRDNLEKAVASFNESIGSLEGRVLVTARKFKDMGVTIEKEIPEITVIDRAPRVLTGDGNNSLDIRPR